MSGAPWPPPGLPVVSNVGYPRFLSFPAPVEGERPAVIDECGQVVALFAPSRRPDRLQVNDAAGSPLLTGRKRHAFAYTRWWDAGEPGGEVRLSLRRRRRGAQVAMVDGPSYTVSRAGDWRDARIVANGSGSEVGAMLPMADGELGLTVRQTGTAFGEGDLIALVALWRQTHTYERAVARINDGKSRLL